MNEQTDKTTNKQADHLREGERESEGLVIAEFRAYREKYGAYTFGVATLLVLWFAILSPQLNRQERQEHLDLRIAVEVLQSVTNALTSVTKQLEQMTEYHIERERRSSTNLPPDQMELQRQYANGEAVKSE